MSSRKKSARKLVRRAHHRKSRRPRLELLESRWAPATFNVPAEIGLVAAIGAAESNKDWVDVINLAPGVYSGNLSIHLEKNAEISLVGQGPGVVLSGGSHVVTVSGSGRVTLEGLSIQGGMMQAQQAYGAGLLVQGGHATLVRVDVTGNTVRGNDGKAGAVAATRDHVGASGGDGGDARGGGIYVASGELTLIDSTVRGNRALGGKGGAGASGPQVGSDGSSGVPTTSRPVPANGGDGQGGSAGDVGGRGGNGGQAWGGGIYVESGTVTLQNTVVESNRAEGGAGGPGGRGRRGGDGGMGSDGLNGTVVNGGFMAWSWRSVYGAWSHLAGQGGRGGWGGSGGAGGAGGDGGDAYGAGVVVMSGTISVESGGVANNVVRAGAGGGLGGRRWPGRGWSGWGRWWQWRCSPRDRERHQRFRRRSGRRRRHRWFRGGGWRWRNGRDGTRRRVLRGRRPCDSLCAQSELQPGDGRRWRTTGRCRTWRRRRARRQGRKRPQGRHRFSALEYRQSVHRQQPGQWPRRRRRVRWRRGPRWPRGPGR